MRKIERPIANGARISEEIETPRRILLISNILLMKLSIRSSTSTRENLCSLSSIKMQIYLIFKIRKFSKCPAFHILWIHHYSSFHLWMDSRIVCIAAVLVCKKVNGLSLKVFQVFSMNIECVNVQILV